MHTVCAPDAYWCHLSEFPQWIVSNHLGMILAIIMATFVAVYLVEKINAD